MMETQGPICNIIKRQNLMSTTLKFTHLPKTFKNPNYHKKKIKEKGKTRLKQK